MGALFFNLSWIQVLTIDVLWTMFSKDGSSLLMFTFHIRFFWSLSAALSESFSLRRAETGIFELLAEQYILL